MLDLPELRGQGSGVWVMFVITCAGLVLGWFLGRTVLDLAQGHQAPDVVMIG